MSTRLFQYAIVAGLFASGGLMWAAQVVRGPYLQSSGTDRMSICWRTDVETTTEVAIAADLAGTFTAVTVPGTRVDHAVDLTGLAVEQRYFYQVHGTPATGVPIDLSGANYWFRTAPANSGNPATRVWVIGDGGYYFPETVTAFDNYMNLTAAEGKQTSLLFLLGDNAYDNGTDAQMQGTVFARYATLERTTPLWSAFGNHDAYTLAAPYKAVTPYETAFRFPVAGECGGLASGNERYYSFNHGDIHFISMDTFTPGNTDDVLGGIYGMADWLQDDLKACTSEWIVAFMHYGPYSVGTHRSDTDSGMIECRTIMMPILEAYGVDLVLTAHSHVYERTRFIDGHYGVSTTFNAGTMVKQSGNGSELGAVSATGDFVVGAGTGPYRKPAVAAHAGTVVTVVGASSACQGWYGGSSALVAPTPYPAHTVSLNLLGSQVLEVAGNRLNSRYLDKFAAVRDDFTILKGATYTVQSASLVTNGGLVSGADFPISRSGYLGESQEISVSMTDMDGASVPPGTFRVVFAPQQETAHVQFTPPAGGAGGRYRLRVNPLTAAIVPGAAQRNLYRIGGTPQEVTFAASPAVTWYASRFDGAVPTPADWLRDHDSDGLPLLVEYALGEDPDGLNVACVTFAEVADGKLIVHYHRAPGRTDVVYRVEGSAELSSWHALEGMDFNDGPVDGRGEPRRVELPMGGSDRYLRLAVSLVQ